MIKNKNSVCKDKLEEALAECKRLEDRLLEERAIFSKMFSEASGGIAHDLNNLMSVIVASSYILQMKTDEESPLRVYIDNIDNAIRKAAELIDGLLVYSRQYLKEKNSGQVPFIEGAGTILLIESEPELRMAIKTVLEDAGYNVLASENGEDAVNDFAVNKNTIGVVVMDATVPYSKGEEVYRAIQKIRSDVKIVFTSANSDGISGTEIFPDRRQFIPQPVSPTDLFAKIRNALGK